MQKEYPKFMVVSFGQFGIGDSIKTAMINLRKVGRVGRKDKVIAWCGTDDLCLENGYVVAKELVSLGDIQ